MNGLLYYLIIVDHHKKETTRFGFEVILNSSNPIGEF